MATSTQGIFYLLTTLEFDVGERVRLYGAIKVTTERDLRFFLSTSGEIPFDINPPPGYEVTTSIAAPFGMTGVVLKNFDIDARIYNQQGKAAADITLEATAVFPGLPGFALNGLLVFEKMSPRLALVRLSVDKPLTLTQLVKHVINGASSWADEITDQFSFGSGYMYYLKPAPDPPPDGYKFSYLDPATKQSVDFLPYYHLDAVVGIFGKEFDIGLSVEGDTFDLHTTSLRPLGFDFVTLTNANLEISNNPRKGTYIRISAGVSIFQTPLTTVAVEYDTTQKAFAGEVSADLGSVNLPTLSGETSRDVALDIAFRWKDGDFSITNIDGLPTNELNLIQKYVDALNGLRSSGCQAILTDWLNGLTTTSLKPSFNGSPVKKGSGEMQLPLLLTYEIKADGRTIATNNFPFPVDLVIPQGLRDLPRALWLSLVHSAGDIALAIISNPDTYKAIAEYVALKAGAQALARLICRALQQFEEALVKALGEFAKGVVADTLAAAAELAGVLVSVALLGLPDVIHDLVSLFEKLWDWITGEDKKKKREAEAQINAQRDKVQAAMNQVWDRIADAKKRIQIDSLKVSINEQNRYVARWTMSNFSASKLGSGTTVSYTLKLLEGNVGSPNANVLPGTQAYSLNINQTQFDISLDAVPNRALFNFNASIYSSATGTEILSPKTEADLNNAIDQLGGIDDDTAQDFANYLRGELQKLKTYNDAIATDPVYAQLGMPAELTIGQSLVGVNTRIRNI